MISTYIHIPFCTNKCSYCGFYSTQYDDNLAERYLSALNREMKIRSGELSAHEHASIYIGGGTPSVFTPAQLSRLFDLIDDHIERKADAEVTVEVNPGTATAKKLSVFAERGVNRLSIGVQSFSDEVLGALGRTHTAREAFDTFRAARAAGFSNIGLDLMYGIPKQTEEQWLQTLESSFALVPEHLSIYSLSIDEGSRLSCDVRSGMAALPDDDIAAGMYLMAVRRLADAGYRQYEISNFCLPGSECLHNSNYWEHGPYLGFGPGASSYTGNRRVTTIADVNEYAARMMRGLSATGSEEKLDRKQQTTEFLFLGLRRTGGIDLDRFNKFYGRCATDHLRDRSRQLAEAGLCAIEDNRLKLTLKGFLLSNEALAVLIP